MRTPFYRSVRAVCKGIASQSLCQVVLHAEKPEPTGGFILACSHLSHLEPIIVSCNTSRPVRWMTRVEFYQSRWRARILEWGGAIPVDRFGCSMRAVRAAARLVSEGNVVGVFPEGGLIQGAQSVLRGGPIKGGACTIAIQSRAPIVPVVVLGTEKLNRVSPWIPLKRGRVWVAFGRQVVPPPRARTRRADRHELASRLQEEFVRTYAHLLRESGLRDDQVP